MRLCRILTSFVVVCSYAVAAQSIRPGWLSSELARVTPSVEATYKDIHQHPELGKQEYRTARLVRERLQAIGFTQFVDEPTLPTAVIAVMDSGRPGNVFVLRAELDARPGEEKAAVDYKSTVPGKMHSCGHDAHTAMLLGAADILFHHKDSLRGKVVFLFQPAEETPGGADDIVRDGIFQKLGVAEVFAQHVAPGLPVGTIQASPGPVMASSTYFTARLHGDGSHAASPQYGADIIRLAAEISNKMSVFPARHLDVIQHPAIVSITHFEAGDHKALNKIPEDAVFEGTVRSYDQAGDTSEGTVVAALNKYLTAEATADNSTIAIDWRPGSPVATNSPVLFARVVPVIASMWSGTLSTQDQRSMYSEDFAYYTASTPSLYFSLGVASGDHGGRNVHTDEFDISLDALPEGIELLVLLAESEGNLPSGRGATP